MSHITEIKVSASNVESQLKATTAETGLLLLSFAAFVSYHYAKKYAGQVKRKTGLSYFKQKKIGVKLRFIFLMFAIGLAGAIILLSMASGLTAALGFLAVFTGLGLIISLFLKNQT
jgi:hypothetical protein